VPEPLKIKAAQYLRMSTEHQRYSLANQADAIAGYADAHGYCVTRSYFDPGISGLTFKERRGLQALLTDALAPNPEFETILVLDVSRWGRFQDLDQSAHYEFLCREAGVPVVYCAEPFRNDGSAEANILKMLKRMMAAEYSRDLSVKVTRAKLCNARLGRHCGGAAPYGFRRLLVDARGRPTMVLPPGSRRSFEGEYVVLTHGPSEELAAIRRIFRMYVQERRGPTAIARQLTRDGVTPGRHPAWSADTVRSILTNELVVGVLVFNRTTKPLKTRPRDNPVEDWIRLRVFQPIVPRRIFEAAQELWGKRDVLHIDKKDMLGALRNLLRQRGRLSAHIIDECPDTPCSGSYVRYFGSLQATYEAIGYKQTAWWGPLRGRPRLVDDQLIDMLRGAYQRHGSLSVAQINAAPELPSEHYFRARFGSLAAAFARAGLPRGGAKRKRTVRVRVDTPPAALARAPADRRRSALSNADLLQLLRKLHERDGYVSGGTLRREPGAPRVGLFQARFGSLTSAYELAGLPSLPYDRMRLAALGRRRRFSLDRATS
jgi:DNA invertase Pin-like site-specific DNA recombinase